MWRFENVAMPPEAAALVVPESVPPAGLVPIAIVIVAVDAVRLSFASSTRTVTAGLIAAPPTVFEGCTPKASLAAAPTVMLNALDVPPERPVDAAVRVY